MKSEDVPSIARLPAEVLDSIIQISPVSSQLSILRVCKLFRPLVLRILYRSIVLLSSSTVIACCCTLVRNNEAASYVRSFMISYSFHSSFNLHLSSYYFLIQRTLRSLSGIHTLQLYVHDPCFVKVLNNCHFTALRRFECYLTPTAPLIEFLNNHPDIIYLQVSPHENTLQSLSLPGDPSSTNEDDPEHIVLPALDLPGLKHFSGNVQSVPFLCGGSMLRAAIISWHTMDTNPDSAFAALQRSSRDSLSLLSCRRRGWNLDLIEAISIKLPDLRSLHISNVLLVDSRPTEDYIQGVRSCLPRFSQLQRLNVTCIDYWEMSNISSVIEEDLKIVTQWGKDCRSLQEISLPHSDGLSWFRISDNIWIPDHRHQAGMKWIRDAIASDRFPSWVVITRKLELDEELPIDLSGSRSIPDIIASVTRFMRQLWLEKHVRSPDVTVNSNAKL